MPSLRISLGTSECWRRGRTALVGAKPRAERRLVRWRRGMSKWGEVQLFHTFPYYSPILRGTSAWTSIHFLNQSFSSFSALPSWSQVHVILDVRFFPDCLNSNSNLMHDPMGRAVISVYERGKGLPEVWLIESILHHMGLSRGRHESHGMSICTQGPKKMACLVQWYSDVPLKSPKLGGVFPQDVLHEWPWLGVAIII